MEQWFIFDVYQKNRFIDISFFFVSFFLFSNGFFLLSVRSCLSLEEQLSSFVDIVNLVKIPERKISVPLNCPIEL